MLKVQDRAMSLRNKPVNLDSYVILDCNQQIKQEEMAASINRLIFRMENHLDQAHPWELFWEICTIRWNLIKRMKATEKFTSKVVWNLQDLQEGLQEDLIRWRKLLRIHWTEKRRQSSKCKSFKRWSREQIRIIREEVLKLISKFEKFS